MTLGTEHVLEAYNITKSFPGVRALDDVTLKLKPGRLTALLGENGAGKSTLMNILSGVTTPDSGRVLIDGREVKFQSTRDARAQGIGVIFQELSLSTNLTVAENIFLGREPRTRWGLLDYARMHDAAKTLLARMNLDVSPTTPLAALRVGQQQVVEIARALSTNARVLIMDEPTSALSCQETDSLLQLVGELKSAGVAVVYITHKFEELANIGDDVAIMRDGKLVAQALLSEISHDDIVRMMVGRQMNVHAKRQRAPAANEVFRAERVSLPHHARVGDYIVRDVDLHAARGEVVGVFGLMGAGRTELLETIFGVHGARGQARIFIDGIERRIVSPERAIAAGLALAPEDRKQQGLVPEMSSRENASLACLRAMTHYGLLSARRQADLLQPLLQRMRLRASALGEPVRNLSGGNQQKVVLAKWLATRPKILLLDEPTRGIDINARNEIYGLIDELAGSGLAVIVVSAELPEILAIADRIVVMCEGRKTAEFARDAATPELLMHAALPRAAVESVA